MWGGDLKQSGSFTHFKTAGHSRFICDTETRYNDEKNLSNIKVQICRLTLPFCRSL